MYGNNKIPPYFHSTKQFVSFYISQSQPLPQVLCGYEKHNNQQKLTAFLLLFYLFLTRTSWDSILVGLWPWKWDRNGEEVKLSMWLLTVDCQHFGRWSVGGRGRDIIQTQTFPDFRPQWFVFLWFVLFKK